MVAKAAVEAFARLAVGAAQLYECLRGECVAALNAGIAEEACDGVVLGRESLKQFDGALLHALVAEAGAVGVEQRHYDVYDKDVGACAAECAAAG